MTSVSYSLSGKSPEYLATLAFHDATTPAAHRQRIVQLVALLAEERMALGDVRGTLVLESGERWPVSDVAARFAAEPTAVPYELELTFAPLVYLRDPVLEAERCDVADLYTLGNVALEPVDVPATEAGAAYRIVGGPSDTPDERLLYADGWCTDEGMSLTVKSTSDFWRAHRFFDDYEHDHDVVANARVLAAALRRVAANAGATVTGELLVL
jgi:hypothetical protein